MDTNKTQPVLSIAGKPYHVLYRLSDLRFIEAEAAKEGRTFMDMASGTFAERAAIIWGGLKNNKNRGTKTIEDVVELLEKHQDEGGNWSRDVFQPCYAAALYSGLGGDIAEHKVDAILRLVRKASGEDAVADEEPGKAVTAAE